MPVLHTCKFKEVAIKIDSAMPRTRSNMGFSSIQGQVTPKHIVHIDRKLNLSKNVCLSWIPACLKKLRSKVKALCPDKVIYGLFSTQGLVALR